MSDEESKNGGGGSGSTSQLQTTQTTNTNVPIQQVAAYAVKLPQFWVDAPDAYFTQAEATFRTARITVSRTKFDYLLQALPQHVISDVLDVITDCSRDSVVDPFEKLKSELITRNTKSEAQRLEQLLSGATMGDRTPSRFYRYMASTAGSLESVNSGLIRSLWIRRLPPNLEIALKPFETQDITVLCSIADSIYEAQSRSGSAVAVEAVQATASSSTLAKLELEIDELKRMIRDMKPYNQERSRSRSRTRDRDDSPLSNDLCFYHSRFGSNARRCGRPSSCPMANIIAKEKKEN